MKELSIQEKAKAYDKAKYIMKEYLESGNAGVIAENTIKKAFPELSESEDERIRKELIDYLSAPHATDTFRGIPWDRVVAWLEKQCEHKPADKVEPKFHLYEWVVTDKNYVFQIKAVNNGYYAIDNGMDFNMSHVDRWWHKWTIQDAKDGDVLCTYECGNPKNVFILKGTPKKRVFSYYCYYNIMYPHFKSDSEKGCLAPNDEDVKPATKEQHELLFQKMKDAGYEWDSVKKELKKIEPTPAWSEEDERILVEILKVFSIEKFEGYNIGENNEDALKFLKSLKDRVQPQPKKEWSEEDEKYYNDILDTVNNDLGLIHVHRDWFKNIKYRIKSISPQNTWKPSDEQLDALHDAAVYVDKSMFPYSKGILMKLYKQLKKLKEE